jgi:DNA-binding NarL/FixJ family response regulator
MAGRIVEDVAEERESGDVLEGLATSLHLASDYAGAMRAYARAYVAYREEGNILGAARAARTVAWFHGSVYGDWAVCTGWMARARTQLEQAGEGGSEQGWVLLAEAQSVGDLREQERAHLAAVDIARRFGDDDLRCEALASLGITLARSGAPRGMPFIDQALATVFAGQVGDLSVAERVFCGLLQLSEQTHDVVRAEQWLLAADEFSRRRGLAAIGGYCRAYYGGLLVAAGRWPEAEVALGTALGAFPAEHRQIRAMVHSRLADLRVRQGRLEEAGQLLVGLEPDESVVRPLAALHLARGEASVARDLLERRLGSGSLEPAVAGPLLALLADVHLALGAVDDAARVVERLSDVAAHQPGDHLKAVAALARGRLCTATGAEDAVACLREALTPFARAHLPVEAARTRLELARALAPTRPEEAVAQATIAHETFARCTAVRDADLAAGLLRSLGAPSGSGATETATLTRRETDVLELLGHRLANPDIGKRLFLSEKMVEHHVGRLLAKLGLHDRAELVAYAVRTTRS